MRIKKNLNTDKMKKIYFTVILCILTTTFSKAQTNDVKLHIKTFNDADGTFIEKEGDGSGTIEYFNDGVEELYIFVEIDPKNLSNYIKSNENLPLTLKLTITKGNILLKEFKKTVGFSYNGFGLNKCFVLFQLNKVEFESYKIKADLMKANVIISKAKKTVNISGGE
jgi:hypothetical protein